MAPKIICPNCASEIALNDKFCRSCGTQIHWSEEGSAISKKEEAHPEMIISDSPVVCSHCGHQNTPDTVYCEACGSTIGTPEMVNAASQKSEPRRSEQPTTPLKKFQSWKLTMALGIVFIIVLVITQMTDDGVQKTPVTPPQQQQQQSALSPDDEKKLQDLENAVNNNPNDAKALLRYANALQDTRYLPQALAAYQHYITMEPTNPDARVDLGVTYFELSRIDSVKHHEYLDLAEKSMQEALKLDPKHQLAYFNLGIVHLHKGEMEKARDWFQQCAAIDSTTETGRRAQLLIQQHSFTNPS